MCVNGEKMLQLSVWGEGSTLATLGNKLWMLKKRWKTVKSIISFFNNDKAIYWLLFLFCSFFQFRYFLSFSKFCSFFTSSVSQFSTCDLFSHPSPPVCTKISMMLCPSCPSFSTKPEGELVEIYLRPLTCTRRGDLLSRPPDLVYVECDSWVW